MEKIRQHIKDNQFQHIYLIFGEEQFTRRSTKKALVNAIVPETDTMNFCRVEGKDINVREVIDLSETLPFFTERRLILIENSGFFKHGNDDLLQYLKSVPETTYFVFCEEEVDKRGKLYKLVKAEGYVCECKRLSADSIMKWILAQIGREKKKITRDTMNYLLELLGDDMDKISGEVEKLLCYTMDKDVIERADVEAVCSPEITGKIFAMIDAMGSKNKTKALELYYDLLMNKEPPMRILYMLSRQFNIMLQIKELSDKGMGRKEMEGKLGMQGFVISKNLNQLKNFSIKEIRSALEQSVEVEEDVKTGNITDKMAVEMMIVGFSS